MGPAGSPSHGGDVAVYVSDINHPSLSTAFCSVLMSIFVFMPIELYFIPYIFGFSLCSSGLISALLVFSNIWLFMKVSFSPDVILCG